MTVRLIKRREDVPPFVNWMATDEKGASLFEGSADGLAVVLELEDKTYHVVSSVKIRDVPNGTAALKKGISKVVGSRGRERFAGPLYVTSDVFKLEFGTRGKGDSGQEQTENEEVFKNLVIDSQKRGASDIHIKRDPEHCTVYTRIFGDIIKYTDWETDSADSIVSVGFYMSEGVPDWDPNQLQRADIEIPLDEHRRITCRYEHAPQGPKGSYHAVLRLFLEDDSVIDEVKPLEDYGYTREQAAQLRMGVRRPSGAVLFCGTTGSGKSTSMGALIRLMNKESGGRRLILTVESPIEQRLPAIQTAVPRGMTMAEVVVSTLRRDPDNLMIGEINNPETADAAKDAVQTGHPVLSTLHTQSPFEAIERLHQLGIDRGVLGSPSFIACVVYQTLIPVLDPESKIMLNSDNIHDHLEPDLIQRIMSVFDDIEDVKLAVRGSSEQWPAGVNGVTVAATVVTPDTYVFSLFREGKIAESVDYWHGGGKGKTPGRVVGFTAMEHAKQKMAEGLVDPRDVESKLGPLTYETVMRDSYFEGDEAELLTGEKFSSDEAVNA